MSFWPNNAPVTHIFNWEQFAFHIEHNEAGQIRIISFSIVEILISIVARHLRIGYIKPEDLLEQLSLC